MVVWRQGVQAQRNPNLSLSIQVIFLLSHHKFWCLTNQGKKTPMFSSFLCLCNSKTNTKKYAKFLQQNQQEFGHCFWELLLNYLYEYWKKQRLIFKECKNSLQLLCPFQTAHPQHNSTNMNVQKYAANIFLALSMKRLAYVLYFFSWGKQMSGTKYLTVAINVLCLSESFVYSSYTVSHFLFILSLTSVYLWIQILNLNMLFGSMTRCYYQISVLLPDERPFR